MGAIRIACSNELCGSLNVELVNNVLSVYENKHEFQCNMCGTEFSIYTRLGKVKIPKEAS